MEQFTQEMMKRLDALAGKLGMAATALWGFYIRQARISGIEDIMWTILFVGTALLFNRWRIAELKQHKTDPVGVFFCGAAVLLSAILSVVFFSHALTALVNPGYWAFQTIVEQLKNQ